MAGGFFGNFSGNLSSGWNKLKSGNITAMNDWEEWAALAVTTAVTIGILSMLFNMIKSFWEENKSLIIMIGLVAIAAIGIPWLMRQFGGNETQEAAVRGPALRGRGPRPADADLGDDTPMRPLSFDNGVPTPKLTEAVWRDVRSTQLGNVEYSEFLPLQPEPGLTQAIEQLQVREAGKPVPLAI